MVAAYGGKLLFGSGDISFSSLDLIRQLGDVNVSTIQRPSDYLARHGLDTAKTLAVLDRMRQLRVCVVGDTIVDEYISCDPLGMSQEDPTIVVTPIMQERFVGGAGIVAAHARSLGAHVTFHSAVGPDVIALIRKGANGQVRRRVSGAYRRQPAHHAETAVPGLPTRRCSG